MSIDERNALVEKHVGLIKKIAVDLARRLPSQVELDDLIQQGYVGAIHAADRYDPQRNDSFAGFAIMRIRGAMLDSVRHYRWREMHYAPLPASLEGQDLYDEQAA